MRTSSISISIATATTLLVAIPWANAQPVPSTLDPSGQTPLAKPPAPPARAEPRPIVINVPGADGKMALAEVEDDSGLYYQDDLVPDRRGNTFGDHVRGPVPEIHVVNSGDTLWDICGFYFSDPWQWPRVWSYNPTITNPHWIYPGDLVRLYKGTIGPSEQPQLASDPDAEEPQRMSVRSGALRLRRLAFVGAEELEDAMTIDGSIEERVMLSIGDGVYLRYSDENKPKPGVRYSVYEELEKVVHPKTKKVVGAYVRIRGELEARSIKKDRRARGVITQATRVIERGHKVGPIKKRIESIEPTVNKRSAQGIIIGEIQKRELIGESQLLILDLGSEQGIAKGNQLYVIRRGDAKPELGNPHHQIGLNDKRFPARAVGQLMIVDVGKHISLAIVTDSTQSLGLGDHVLMRAKK